MIGALQQLFTFLMQSFITLWNFLIGNELGWPIIGFFVLTVVFGIFTRLKGSRDE